MKAKYKLGTLVRADMGENETTTGEIVSITMTKDGVSYRLENDFQVDEQQITQAFKAVTPRAPAKKKTTPKNAKTKAKNQKYDDIAAEPANGVQ